MLAAIRILGVLLMEVVMTATAIRRVPWTCRWGRFGVAVDDTGLTPRLDDVFWACHRPVEEIRRTTHGECEHCLHWEAAPNPRPEPD